MVSPAPRPLVVALVLTTVPPAVAQALTVGVSAAGSDVTASTAAGIVAASFVVAFALVAGALRELPGPRAPSTPPWPAIALGTLPILAAIVGVLAWTAGRPVLDWDGLYYHVPAVQGWWQLGGVRWIGNSPDVPFVNGYPMALETLGYLGVHLLGHDRWLDAWNVLLWPAAGVGLAFTAHLWGARRAWTAVAALSFLLVPAWILGSTVAYVDAGFAAATCAFLAATTWRLQRNDHVAAALLWGIAGGLSAAAKGTGLVIAVLATTLLVVDVARRPALQRTSAGRALALGVAALVVIGGAWPVRAIVHTGNPIHPVELRIGAKQVGAGIDAHQAVAPSLPEDLRRVPPALRPLAVWARPFTAIDGYDQAEGLGPLWTFGALPGLAFVLWRGRRRLDVVGPIALVVVGLGLQPGPWWARLSLWGTAVGLPAFAVLASVSTARTRKPLARAVGAAFVVAVLGAAAFTTGDAVHRDLRRPHGATALDHYFAELVAHPDWTAFAAAPRVARTDWGRTGTLLGGALASPIGAREIVHVARLADVPDDTHWVLWDTSGGSAPGTDAGWIATDRPRAGFVLLRRVPAPVGDVANASGRPRADRADARVE